MRSPASSPCDSAPMLRKMLATAWSGSARNVLAVGAVLGVPLVADAGEVVDEQLGEEREVGGAALGDRATSCSR